MDELIKISESDLEGKGVYGQPDVPGLSAEEMQEKVEEIVRSVAITKINEIIDYVLTYGATKDDLDDLIIAAGAVTSVFGRKGRVEPKSGDYTAEMVGAAKNVHAQNHNLNGSDPLDLNAAGIAPISHSHGNITSSGKVGSLSGKVLMTESGGTVAAKSIEDTNLTHKPYVIPMENAASFSVEENTEYILTNIEFLNMVGDGVNAHGFIMFAGTTPTIEVSDFTASFGDDITTAAENELWEFSVSHPDNYPYSLIIWKNWGVLE